MSLWDVFVAWLAGQFGLPGEDPAGLSTVEEDQGRFHVPGG